MRRPASGSELSLHIFLACRPQHRFVPGFSMPLLALPRPTGAFASRLSAERSPFPPLNSSTTVTGLLCGRDSHPLGWQLARRTRSRRAGSTHTSRESFAQATGLLLSFSPSNERHPSNQGLLTIKLNSNVSERGPCRPKQSYQCNQFLVSCLTTGVHYSCKFPVQRCSHKF